MRVVTRDNEIHEAPWQAFGACLRYPPEMFEIAFEGDPIAEDLKRVDIKNLNDDNLSAAVRVCQLCPVRSDCLEEASVEDMMYHVRGGRLPLEYNPKRIGRPRKDALQPKADNRFGDRVSVCKNGHDNWSIRSRGNGKTRKYCKSCEIDRRNAARKAADERFDKDPTLRAKLFADRIASMEGKVCAKGHSNWGAVMDRGAPRSYCKTCKAGYDRVGKSRAST